MLKFLFYSFGLVLLLTACGDASNSASVDTGAEPTATATATEATSNGQKDKTPVKAAAAESNDPTLIQNDEFLGIRPGQKVVGINNLKKDMLRTSEGKMQVYSLSESDGRAIGYIAPERKDPSKVGSIHITSKNYQTPTGISVGSTFAELEAAHSDVSVHGSEVEGRTYATVGKLSFRLDASNTSYELDKSAIEPQIRITEIIVK